MHDRPIFIERRFDEFVQFAIGLEALRIRLFNRSYDSAQFFACGACMLDDVVDRGFDLAQEAASDRLVDFGLRREKPVNVGWRHAQIAGNIRNRGLLEADLAEQTLGTLDDDPMRVVLLKLG